MRPRCALVLVAVAAAGCGGSDASRTATRAAGGERVVLNLKAGHPQTITACGAAHHYTAFASGARIEFAGTVTPVPQQRWKVKVKVKVCRSGAFVDLEKVDATRDKHSGAFAGTLPSLARGNYFARAGLYIGGRQAARGDKAHFAVR